MGIKQSVVSPGAIVKANSDLQSLAKSIGRVVNGNKSTTGASAGQFVVLLSSTISGRADGLYTAAKAIPANTAIDSSYLTASESGLNALNGKFVGYSTVELTKESSSWVGSGLLYYKQIGNMVFFFGYVISDRDQQTSYGSFNGLPGSIENMSFIATGGGTLNTHPTVQIRADGNMRAYNAIGGNQTSSFSGVYFTSTSA